MLWMRMTGKSSTLTHAEPFFTRAEARPAPCPSKQCGVHQRLEAVELDTDGI